MDFTMQDIGLAYRKAKVDLYYSSHATVLNIAEYESQLAGRLGSLLGQVNGVDENWVNAEGFFGAWTVVPKSIKPADVGKQGNGVVCASPKAQWQKSCRHALNVGAGRPAAEFRLMARCSLDFHVLSALWMAKVGEKFDAQLSPRAFGNRLRRSQNGSVNPLSLGSFKPYTNPFRTWRDGGIESMRSALASSKKVAALTADVSSFYHELNPSFMLDERFNKLFEIRLTVEEEKLHRLFIKALIAWAASTPLKRGLPVGLPASAVVANMALIELDRLIEGQVAPLYYGRYVDDILLVIENGANFQSTVELWQWLFARSNNMLGWVGGGTDKIQFRPPYLESSRIIFDNGKNKVFLLEGESGRMLVDSIASQICQRASEWRALPNLPPSAPQIGTQLIAATQNDGEPADNLRKTDVLSMRRAGFAIMLRDFEAYERDLHPSAWREHRHAFLSAFVQHVLVLPYFFELELYLPRVVRLATSCEDFGHLQNIVSALKEVFAAVAESCEIGIKACSREDAPGSAIVLKRWTDQLVSAVYESILASFPPSLSKHGNAAWCEKMESLWKEFFLPSMESSNLWAADVSSIQAAQAWLFSFDLAHMPFRFLGLPREMVTDRGIPHKAAARSLPGAELLLPDSVVSGVSLLADMIKTDGGLSHGLLFATRPFTLAELFVLGNDPFAMTSRQVIRSVVLALRGFDISEKWPVRDSDGVLLVSDGKQGSKHVIAVSSWKTEIGSWVAAVSRNPDPDLGRYARLIRLINRVIAQPKGARYFVLPELAMPAHWFVRFANKLQGRGISLISGIEYQHEVGAGVRNQVWAALTHDGLGFPSMMIYRQDKQQAALHEEQELQRVAGLELKPANLWKKPPIVQHGEFRFALLVCSELTNISHRAELRGNVDAVMVPEWNQDTESFNALVESAALDIHAYIVQCNDRQYGDSRIRAPSKESWQRDVLRVKGGIDDYCVIGEIDIHALRRFQSGHRSPPGPFKPVPDGFVISPARKTLPSE